VLGNSIGWRGAFGVMLALAAVVLIAAVLVIPSTPGVRDSAAGQARNAFAPRVLALLAVFFLVFTANSSLVTYLIPFLSGVTGVSGSLASVFLFAYGAATLIGSTYGGRFANPRAAARTVIVGSVGLCCALVALDAVGSVAVPVAIVLVLLGLSLRRPHPHASPSRRRVMTYDRTNLVPPPNTAEAAFPPIVDRSEFEAAVAALRVREKAHTRESDAIAAARRRLPMVEIDGGLELLGPAGSCTLLDAFMGRQQLLAYYFMWNPGHPAEQQCEGCTFYTSQLAELAYLHSRDITYAVLCQGRNTSVDFAEAQTTYDESLRYREFMGWTHLPWYSAQPSLTTLLGEREIGLFHIISYLRQEDRVFETYWTRRRGVEALDNSYALMDLTVYGRQEAWEDSPAGWPQQRTNTRSAAGTPDWPPVSAWPDGRPIGQWPRLAAGHSDDLGNGNTPASPADSCCH
jgi:predicted dithiol-disulfide oxidoreductase (DUF899 family)